MLDLSKMTGFQWDQGNINKNLIKHQVTNQEAEEIFISEPNFVLEDKKHSVKEKRYMIWSVTNQDRKLSVFFTIRRDKIRIISARDMHKSERREYAKKIEANSQV